MYEKFARLPTFLSLPDIKLDQLAKCIGELLTCTRTLSESDWSFVEAMIGGSELIIFLKQVVNEGMLGLEFVLFTAIIDLRNLIDAVESHSDQFIRESTVSDLIDVKSFFQGVLRKKLTAEAFLTFIGTAMQRDSSLPAKVPNIPKITVIKQIKGLRMHGKSSRTGEVVF